MVRTDQPLVERMALVFHDWFATSIAGVSKQQQMIDQSNLFRVRLLRLLPRPLQGGDGRPGDAAVAERRRKPQERAERELRPRDDGAVLARRRPRRLHRGRHPRTGAGADRLAQRLVERAGRLQLPLRPQTPRHRTARRSSAQTGNWGWEDACRLCVENPLHPSFFVDKLWSYFVAAAALGARPATALIAHLPRLRLADPAGARGDPAQPRPLRRPADGEAAGRPAGRDAAGARPLRRHRRLDLALRTGRAACSSGRPTSPAGTTRRWLDTSRMRARWNIVDYALDEHLGRRLERRLQRPPRPPRKRWPGRSPPGARRRCAPSTGPSCSTSPSAARNSIVASWQQGPYRAMRQNALLQLIGVSPDLILQ